MPNMRYSALPTANKAATMAAKARILSNVLTVDGDFGAGAGRGAGAVVARGAAAVGAAAGAAALRGAAGAGALGAMAGAGAALAAPVGPPGGSVGSLMVGAAEGFGGKLMRTVSFLGWTLPVSFFGGTAPLGIFGMLSAITNVGPR